MMTTTKMSLDEENILGSDYKIKSTNAELFFSNNNFWHFPLRIKPEIQDLKYKETTLNIPHLY